MKLPQVTQLVRSGIELDAISQATEPEFLHSDQTAGVRMQTENIITLINVSSTMIGAGKETYREPGEERIEGHDSLAGRAGRLPRGGRGGDVMFGG